MSQTELARRTGIERTALTKIEGGRRSLSATELGRIASALQTSAEQLLKGTVRPPTIAALRRERAAIERVASKHGARRVRVFGSVARGEADEQSDIDLLVEMEPGRSLLDVAALMVDLSALTGRKVDVVTPAGLRPRIRDRVLAEAVDL